MVKKSKAAIQIAGPFLYIQCAAIQPEVADQIRAEMLDPGDIEGMLQSSPDYFSLYGANFSETVIELDGVFEYSAQSGGDPPWFINAPQRSGGPDDMFLKESLDLKTLPNGSGYLVTVDLCEGKEDREFSGKFSREKLILRQVSLTFGESELLAQVIQVDYEGAEIVDQTEQYPAAAFYIRDGSLEQLY